MGLPVFITPVEPEVGSASTEKAAAGLRSSIRRQRVIRGSIQARSSENRRRRIHDILEIEARENQQNNPLNGSDLSSIASLQARANRLFENERTALSEPLSWERQHQPGNVVLTESDGTFMPPAPDPELENRLSREREIERLHQVRRELRRMGRRRPAPTPPYTETDITFGPRRARDSPRPSSLTPARSPARLSPIERPIRGDAETVHYRPEESDLAALNTARASRSATLGEEHNRPSLLDRADRSERVQALNRASSNTNNMGRPRSSFGQFFHQRRMDGLGDRDRSLSPEGGSAWDTLLTGITPDPQPPSAGSSFASSAAAATAPSSQSGPTWMSPSMISPERTDESPNLRDCDEPTSSESNTEDDEEDMYELQDFNNTRGPRFWRSTYADIARPSRGAESPDSELQSMHRIISRLAERDDIPESWWASVGLRRETSA